MEDIRQTTDGDIDLSAGDIVMTESTRQHQRDLLLAVKGGNKEFPAVGVCAVDYLHGGDSLALLRACRKECARDGMKVNEVAYRNGELIIDAAYENDNG